MTDALGNPIEIGKRYGYSRNESGFSFVRIGKISKINEKSVSMKVEVAKRALYSQPFEEEYLDKKTVSIRSDMLFPVNHISTPLTEKITNILKEIFEDYSNSEEILNVEIVDFQGFKHIDFNIYDDSRKGTFSNSLRIHEDKTVTCWDIHEIWEGGDVASKIKKRLTEFFKNESH